MVQSCLVLLALACSLLARRGLSPSCDTSGGRRWARWRPRRRQQLRQPRVTWGSDANGRGGSGCGCSGGPGAGGDGAGMPAAEMAVTEAAAPRGCVAKATVGAAGVAATGGAALARRRWARFRQRAPLGPSVMRQRLRLGRLEAEAEAASAAQRWTEWRLLLGWL